ncbi:hypothetical protein BVC80_1769g79 [Macleaya cordata]|uniref:Uncharacterized protein n=1 Tax=Macleaya cordata TaxID=56857 RepID=A0A200QTP1_MACCD|nr:hypothetical protein BVC80_1769g79 [Macleaya cordata]
MALQQHFLFSPSLSSVSSPSSLLPMAITATPMSRFQGKCLDLQPKYSNRVQICTHFRAQERGSLIVQASSDIDGVTSGSNEPEPEPKEEAVSVENLPLESKLQLKLEAKLRMKLAKKIRLRRKRLVRKRQLRKKGRWPPSKMKKNKNGARKRIRYCEFGKKVAVHRKIIFLEEVN